MSAEHSVAVETTGTGRCKYTYLHLRINTQRPAISSDCENAILDGQVIRWQPLTGPLSHLHFISQQSLQPAFRLLLVISGQEDLHSPSACTGVSDRAMQTCSTTASCKQGSVWSSWSTPGHSNILCCVKHAISPATAWLLQQHYLKGVLSGSLRSVTSLSHSW